MGHDIRGWIPGTTEKIAHLRLSGEKQKRTMLYSVLNVKEFNAIDSGTGGRKIFDCKTLKSAERSNDLTTAEQIFISQCLSYCSKEGIEIEFA